MNIIIISENMFRVIGGMERFTANLANFLTSKGHNCTILHSEKNNNLEFFYLDNRIQNISISFSDIISIKTVSKQLSNLNPDVICVLSCSSYVLWIVAACNRLNIPLLISEHNTPDKIEELWSHNQRVASMYGADSIHLLNKEFKSSLPNFLQSRITIIPNPAPDIIPIDWTRENQTRKKLLIVSRLYEKQKQISLLIQAFSLLVKSHPTWDCYICGDGPSREYYQNLIIEKNIQDRFFLVGEVKNIDKYYRSSCLFCIPSRYEGMPLALLEAQAYGLPSIGFAACPGVNELIIHGENGLLVESMTVSSLLDGLYQLMSNADLRHKYAKGAHTFSLRYSSHKIFHEWEDLLIKTSTYKGKTQLNYPITTEEESTKLNLMAFLSNPVQAIQEPQILKMRLISSGIRKKLKNI